MLPRYHLENYFLEAGVLSKVFRTMEPQDSWLCDPEQVHAKLLDIARSFVPYTVALVVAATYRERIGNLDIMPNRANDMSLDELHEALLERRSTELARIQAASDPDAVVAEATKIHDSLVKSIEADSDDWRRNIPGRPVLNTFCSSARIAPGRLRTLYIRHASETDPQPFAEILEILSSFSVAN